MHYGGSEEYNKSNEQSAGPEFELRSGMFYSLLELTLTNHSTDMP